jgi:hypothetical protein
VKSLMRLFSILHALMAALFAVAAVIGNLDWPDVCHRHPEVFRLSAAIAT